MSKEEQAQEALVLRIRAVRARVDKLAHGYEGQGGELAFWREFWGLTCGDLTYRAQHGGRLGWTLDVFEVQAKQVIINDRQLELGLDTGEKP